MSFRMNGIEKGQNNGTSWVGILKHQLVGMLPIVQIKKNPSLVMREFIS